MKILGRPGLFDFVEKHATLKNPVASWIAELEEANWRSPLDLRKRYPSASILSQNRVIFNIKGNSFRIEVKMDYVAQVVLIKRFGTHAEYSRWEF